MFEIDELSINRVNILEIVQPHIRISVETSNHHVSSIRLKFTIELVPLMLDLLPGY